MKLCGGGNSLENPRNDSKKNSRLFQKNTKKKNKRLTCV